MNLDEALATGCFSGAVWTSSGRVALAWTPGADLVTQVFEPQQTEQEVDLEGECETSGLPKVMCAHCLGQLEDDRGKTYARTFNQRQAKAERRGPPTRIGLNARREVDRKVRVWMNGAKGGPSLVSCSLCGKKLLPGDRFERSFSYGVAHVQCSNPQLEEGDIQDIV